MSHLSYPITDYCFNTPIDNAECMLNTTGTYPANKLATLLTSALDNKWVQFFVPEVIDIPAQKPDLEGIVSINSCIEIISSHVIKTPVVTGYVNEAGVPISGLTITNAEGGKLTGRKLIITGLLKQKVIYTALVADQSLHSASFSIPFSTYIIVDPNIPLSQRYKVNAYLEDVWALPLSPRSIFKNSTIFIKATPL